MDQRTKAAGVAVIGSLMTDVVAVSPRLPRPGETVAGESFHIVAGGKGANQAAMAARMDVPTWMVGCVGSDVFQDVVYAALKASGVNAEFVRSVAGAGTGVAHIRVGGDGNNDIVIIPNANQFTDAGLVDQFFAADKPVSVLLLQLEAPLATAIYAARRAKERGWMVVLNPAPAPNRPLPAELWPYIDVITPNETEAGLLTDVEVVDPASAELAARRLQDAGVRDVIVTLGGQGVIHLNERGCTRRPTFPVTVVDTTAAGDAFSGALGAALATGRTVAEAVPYGVAAGALACTRLGAQSSLPRRVDVEALVAGVGRD